MLARTILQQNDYVYLSDKTKIFIKSKISAGGEGTIFNSSNGDICKIYHENHLSLEKISKLKLMVRKQVNIKGVCWPKDLLYNKNNMFVGYTMKKAQGLPMQHAIFTKPMLTKNFPHWTRKNLVELSITMLQKIVKLHEKRIIIGDINPFNILIQSDSDVYFVDTDSYQIENFRCAVGTINFTPPELHGKDYKTIHRTKEHENFAVATLLFMTLLPGKPPYSQQGGGTPGENIRNKDFSYPFKGKSNKKAPHGSWRFIWSHLPYKIKEAFYNTFRENQRLSSSEWLDLMKDYRKLIKKNHISDELFPVRLKLKDPVDATCSDCHKKDRTSKTHWQELQDKRKQYLCEECKEIRLLTKEIKQIKEIKQVQKAKPQTHTNKKQTKQVQKAKSQTHTNKKQTKYIAKQLNTVSKESSTDKYFIIITIIIIIWLIAHAVK